MKLLKPLSYCLNIFLFTLPLKVFAVEEVAAAASTAKVLNVDPINSGYITQLVIGLFVVLLCILVLAWFAKKMNRFQSLADGSLKVIGGLSMGSRERVALLQVGDEQLLIGISPGRISKLHVLSKPIEMNSHPSASAVSNSFLDKFNTMMADATSAKKQNKE